MIGAMLGAMPERSAWRYARALCFFLCLPLGLALGLALGLLLGLALGLALGAAPASAAHSFANPNAPVQQQQQQQQFLWQQALQTLAVDPRFASAGGAVVPWPQAPTTAAVQQVAPFLATLTIPHLMQYNLQQQQLQQQQQAQQQQLQQQQQPAVASETSFALAPPVHHPHHKTKRAQHPVQEASSAKKPRGRKPQPKRCAGVVGDTAGPSVVSNGSSSNPHSHNHSSNINNNNGDGGSNSCNVQLIDGMDNLQPPTEKSVADLEKMTAAERRRYERNLREQ
jgi:hypothetical protein